MRIDGFRPADCDAFAGFSPRTAARVFHVVDGIARHLHVGVEGIENLPRGRALVVGNHTFGWDPIFAMAAVQRELGRSLWVLGEHAWWRFPFLRRLAAAVGTVDGTPANLDCLLANDELDIQPLTALQLVDPQERSGVRDPVARHRDRAARAGDS